MQLLCTNTFSSQRGDEDPIEWDGWLVTEALQDNESLELSPCSSNNLRIVVISHRNMSIGGLRSSQKPLFPCPL